MSSIIKAAARRRTYWLASSFLVPVLSLGFSAAKAQQSASPNLLPTIEVEAPSDKSRPRPEPAPDRTTVSRRVVPTPQQAPTNAHPPVTPAKEQAIVLSPTATHTPIPQLATPLPLSPTNGIH